MSIGDFFSDHLDYTRIFNINNFIEGYFSDDFIDNCSFDINFLNNKLFDLLNNCNFFLCYRFLDNWFLDDMLSYNSLLLDHRNLFSDNERNLNFDCLNFCLKYLHFLILNSVSVCRNSNLANNFIGNSSLYFNFNWFFSFNYSLYNPLNFYNFNNLFDLYNNLFNRYLDDLFYFFYNHKWHWNFNNLQNWLLDYNNLLDYFWYFYNFFDYSWNNDNLFNNFFNLYNSWYFYNFFYDSISVHNFNLHNLFLDYYWNWFLNLDSFYNFLSNWNQSHFLNFELSDFFREIRNRNFSNNRYLLSYVHGNSFFDFYIFSCQDFLDNRLINKDLNLFDDLDLITLYEMRSFNENFFWNFTNNFPFLNYRNFFYDFFVFISIDKSIPVLYKIDYLNLILFNLYRDFLFNVDYLFLFDYVVYGTFDLFVLGLLYYNWHSHLDLLDLFNGLVDIMRYFYDSFYFNIFLLICCN